LVLVVVPVVQNNNRGEKTDNWWAMTGTFVSVLRRPSSVV